MRLSPLAVTAVAFFALAGCSEKDTTAPPPPNVDPVESPTSKPKQTLTGSAEFGSTVRISGGKADVEVKADPFTARFRAEVELARDATNTLSLTSTDTAGNTSEAVQVEIVHKTAVPLPPSVDPVESPTAKLTQTISGSAQPGSTVRISGGKADVQTKADPFTARFWAVVELKADATNTLSLTATDADGNTSEAAHVEIIHHTAVPPPPNVDPVESPTASLTQTITGSAQPGSTVRIRGGKATVEVKADPFTARFRAVVELNADATNTLLITATDAAGTSSEAVQVQIVHQTGYGYTVALELTKAAAVAGELVGIRARVLDANGKEVLDAPFTFTVSPALAATFTVPGSTPAIVKDQGVLATSRQFVAYDLSAVAASGYEFTITATSSAGTALTASAPIVVRPAAGNSISNLQFSPSGTTLTVAAGGSASYTYKVLDLYGNPASTPVTVFTNAPGAVVVDDGISGAGQVTRLSTMGDYTVSFYLSGAGLKGTLQLSVGVGPGAVMDLMISTTLASPNTNVLVIAQMRDAFGNPISCTTPTLADVAFSATGVTSGAVAPQSTSCLALGSSNAAFEAIYKFAAEDNFAIEAEYKPGGISSGIKRAVYVTVLAFDNTPPTIQVQQVRHNGVLCAASPCTVRPGELIEFIAQADDNKSLSEISYTAFFSTAGNNQQLRTRTVLIPNNAVLPVAQYFAFSVPNAIVEDVPLTAMAIDGAGNRATSTEFILRVSYLQFGNRTTAVVARDLGGNLIDQPFDIAFAPDGGLFIANAGNNVNANPSIVYLSGASQVPVMFADQNALSTAAGGGFDPNFLNVGPDGKLYATAPNRGRVLQFAVTPPPNPSPIVAYTSGAILHGLGSTGATYAKALVHLGVPQDGDRLTIGTVTYEINTTGGCAAGNVCVAFAGATGAAAATAIADCINTGAGCAPAAASTTVTAAVDTTGGAAVVLAAKTAGAAGNSIALGVAGALGVCPARIQLNAGCTATSLAEGRDPSFFVAQENGGWAPGTIFRFPFGMTTPNTQTALNIGTFDMAAGGNPGEQRAGLAVKDLASPLTRNLRDFAFYFADANQGNALKGMRFTDAGPATAIFNSAAYGGGGRNACPDCILGTNDPATPTRRFNNLWDMQLEPKPQTSPLVTSTGCLLVSEPNNGNFNGGAIYSVDTSDPTNPDPLVSLVASGLPSPRGMKFAPNGDLYVALEGINAIIKISPAGGGGCF